MIKITRLVFVVVVSVGVIQLLQLVGGASRKKITSRDAASTLASDKTTASGHSSRPNTDVRASLLGQDEWAMVAMLKERPQAARVQQFDLVDVSRALIGAGREANRSAWTSHTLVGPAGVHTVRGRRSPVVSLAVVNGAQGCLLDNFLAHLGRLAPAVPGGLAFPPLVVFGLDAQAAELCSRTRAHLFGLPLAAVSGRWAGGQSLAVWCVGPRGQPASAGGGGGGSRKKMLVRAPAEVSFGDEAYRTAVWTKPMLLSLALAALPETSVRQRQCQLAGARDVLKETGPILSLQCSRARACVLYVTFSYMRCGLMYELTLLFGRLRTGPAGRRGRGLSSASPSTHGTRRRLAPGDHCIRRRRRRRRCRWFWLRRWRSIGSWTPPGRRRRRRARGGELAPR